MYLITKDRKAIINLSYVTSLYIGANGITLKADFDNGKGCQIGTYESEEECKRAIHIIAQEMGKAEYFLAPAKEDVKNKTEEVWHHATGKKTKGHGGS